jgi:hypothetical protein
MSMNPVHLGVNESNVLLFEDSITNVANGANATLNIAPPSRGSAMVPLLVSLAVEQGGPAAKGKRVWKSSTLAIVSYDEASGDLVVTNGTGGAATGKVTAFFTAAS